ncbi:hypothetical protein OK074_1610 [Actinobacteria bacterium OK074]|nr:hypothetical protein OK074_1610 [Actinobacteria bacterium OK074]
MSDTPHHDVHGTGPVLLIIPGGAGHPMGLDGLTEHLAERFTVVTYDPLGLAHGRLGQPVPEQRVPDWSDGARRLLDTVLPDGESAYVIGFSTGAVVALDLLARHPERLRHVVAHEPPVVGILPDADRQRAMFAQVYDVYRTEGLAASAARMTAGLTENPWEPSPGEPQPLSPAEELTNPTALSITRVLRSFTAHTTDLTALAAHSARLTLAVGATSRGGLLHRTATLAAELTGAPLAEFPGGHLGALEHPAEFAERLEKTLSAH